MSRGLGSMERAVLDALGQRQLTMYGLMWHVFGTTRPAQGVTDCPPLAATDAQRVSLRRAVRSLERKGLVKTEDSRDNPGYGRLHRKSITRKEASNA